MAIHRTMEIKIVECDTEELDANKMGVHRTRRYVRVDISDAMIIDERAMQTVAFEAKMEYARQSAKASRKARAALSGAQFVALLWMVKHGKGKIVRRPGGFWTVEDMQRLQLGCAKTYPWHTGVSTLMALENKGLVKRVGEEPNLQYWSAPREITPAGLLALDAAIDSGQRDRIARDHHLWNLHDALKVEAGWGKR
jgi:hypothetical protein